MSDCQLESVKTLIADAEIIDPFAVRDPSFAVFTRFYLIAWCIAAERAISQVMLSHGRTLISTESALVTFGNHDVISLAETSASAPSVHSARSDAFRHLVAIGLRIDDLDIA